MIKGIKIDIFSLYAVPLLKDTKYPALFQEHMLNIDAAV